MTQGEELMVLSANCQGLQNKNKRHDVLHYFRQTNAAIICLEDTHWIDSDESFVKTIWKGGCFLCGKTSNSRGVAIFLSSNFEYNIRSKSRDSEGNMISLDIDIANISLKLLNLYAPNKDSPQFFEEIKGILETNRQMYTIICGDLNLVLNPHLDCDKYKHINNPKSRKELLEILEIFDLKDTFSPSKSEEIYFKKKKPLSSSTTSLFSDLKLYE